MFKGILTAAIATGLVASMPAPSAPLATANPDVDALLAQVKQIASQGQDPQTAAQVDQFVDQNRAIISSVLTFYLNYIKHIQTMTNNDGMSPSDQPQAAQPSGNSQNDLLLNPAGAEASPEVQTSVSPISGGLQSSSIQPAGELRGSSIQPSTGLRTGHLAGYPSLPDVVPVSSVKSLSVEEAEYALKVEKENMARKEYLMAHPEGYSY
jgi:hypothetical protein